MIEIPPGLKTTEMPGSALLNGQYFIDSKGRLCITASMALRNLAVSIPHGLTYTFDDGEKVRAFPRGTRITGTLTIAPQSL